MIVTGAGGNSSGGVDDAGHQIRHDDLTEPRLDRPSWTILTNHGHVMVALSRNPDLRQRDLGYVVGITPGAVQRIIDDLVDAGYLRRERVGRRNHYEVIVDEPLRHPLEHDHTIGEILEKLNT